MSSDFYLMVLQIPEVVTLEYIKSLREKAASIDMETAYILNTFISYDIEDIDVPGELEEEDLYNLNSDSLKIKHAAKQHLVDAVDCILAPRIGFERRAKMSLSAANVKYINIDDHTYVVSGYESSYSSKSPSKAYSYLVALNISSIINL